MAKGSYRRTKPAVISTPIQGSWGKEEWGQSIDENDYIREQRMAFLSEFMLQDTPSLFDRFSCALGAHGRGQRDFDQRVRLKDGSLVRKVIFESHHYCVRCGHEWKASFGGWFPNKPR